MGFTDLGIAAAFRNDLQKKKKTPNEPMNKTKKSTKTQMLRVIYAYPQVDFKSY